MQHGGSLEFWYCTCLKQPTKMLEEDTEDVQEGNNELLVFVFRMKVNRDKFVEQDRHPIMLSIF